MRQIRFAAIAFVSLVAAIASSFIDPGTFFHRTLSFTLCSVLGFTSNLCYANLARNSGERAVAALPPIEQTQNTVPTLDFSPYLQSTRPEFEGSEPTTKPETSNPPSNSSPPQPSPSTPINTPSPSDRNPEPSQLVPGSSGTSNVPCNPTLLTASAQPAKEVIVKGVPTNLTELVAGIKVDELKGIIPLPVRRLENGDVALFAPLHPTKGKAGGNVELVVGSSNTTCSVLNLLIEPLAPAPGATNRLIASLEQYNNKIAQGLGISQTILDDSNNPNSLKAILAGTAPILEGQRIDLELLDSLIANSGAIESLESLVKEIPKLQAKVDSSRDYKVASLVKSASDLGYLPPIASGSETTVNQQFPANVASVDPITPALTTYLCNSEKIKTAKQLSVCMKYQKEYDDFFRSKYPDLKKRMEAVGEAATTAALAAVIIALAAAIPTAGTSLGASIPALETAETVNTIAGSIAFEAYVVLKIATGLLPSELKELTFNVSKTSFSPNDNAPGALQDTKLKAANNGWEITPEEIQNFVKNFVEKQLGKAVARYINVEELDTDKVAKKFLDKAKNIVTEEIGKTLAKPLEKIAEGFKIKLQTLKIPLTSRTFEVDATPSKSPEAIEAISTGVIAFESSNNNYRPTSRPGEGKVNVRTKPGSFGGAQPVDYFSPIITVDKDDDDKPQPQPCCGGGGSSWGEPHLVTFDGLKYDHQAVGEFILAKSTDGAFEVQVREAAVPASAQVSLNSAVAMKVGSTRVAFYVKDFPDSDTTNPLRVDGKPTVIQGGSLSLPGGGSISQVNQGSYIVEWPTGERVGVKVDNFGSSALLDINPALPQTRQGQLIGLLGNFNGNPDDDLKSRDGKVLPPQSTINQVSQITQNLTNWVPIPLNQVESLFLEQLHKQFGDSWRISQQESLFDYAPGKNTESYTNRAFPNGFQVLRMLLPAQVQAAEAACRQAGVPSERLEGCLFDVGVTGNADFAKVAANALTNIVRDRIQNEIQQRIPVPVKIPGLPF